mmetsp:Transcript_22600/g.43159  ORF Transcript_22600/g.43159 Transcript_22600/m.43159 type:complete len:224 (-) Transcript_22600:194-865(-)
MHPGLCLPVQVFPVFRRSLQRSPWIASRIAASSRGRNRRPPTPIKTNKSFCPRVASRTTPPPRREPAAQRRPSPSPQRPLAPLKPGKALQCCARACARLGADPSRPKQWSSGRLRCRWRSLRKAPAGARSTLPTWAWRWLCTRATPQRARPLPASAPPRGSAPQWRPPGRPRARRLRGRFPLPRLTQLGNPRTRTARARPPPLRRRRPNRRRSRARLGRAPLR